MQELEDRMASPRMTQHQSPHQNQAHHLGHGGMMPQLSEEEKMLYAAAAQASRFDRLAAAAGGSGVGGAGSNSDAAAAAASTTFNPAAAYGNNAANGLGNPAAAGFGASLKQPFGAAAAAGGMGGMAGMAGLNRFAGLGGVGAGSGMPPMPTGVPPTQTPQEDPTGGHFALHTAAADRAAHARAAAYAAYAEAELAYREAMLAASVGENMIRNQAQQQGGAGGAHDPSSAAAAVLALSGGGAAGAAGNKGGAAAGRGGPLAGAGMGLPPQPSSLYPTGDPASQSAALAGASDPAMAAAALLQPLGANEGPRRISASSASQRPGQAGDPTASSSLSSNGASMSNSPHLRASMEPTPLPAQGVVPSPAAGAAAAGAVPKKKKQTRQVKPGGKKRGRKPGSKNKPKPIDPLADAAGLNGQKRKRRKKRTKKPKDMPKRPLSAYNIYFREQRTKILEAIPTPAGYGDDDRADGDESRQDANNKGGAGAKHVQEIEIEVIPAACLGGEPRSLRFSRPHGKISFQELAKIIGGNWRNMGESERSVYKNLAAQDSLRYKQEMEAWHRANDSGGQRTPSASSGAAATSLAGLGVTSPGEQTGNDATSTESSDIEYHSAAEDDGGAPARKKQRQLVKLVKNA